METLLLESFGYAGLAAATAIAIARMYLPLYRDHIMPAKIAGIRESAAAQTRIAVAVEGMRSILEEMHQDIADIKLDQARLYVIKQAEQPSLARRHEAAGAPA